MGKAANAPRIAENEAMAFGKMIRSSARKLNLVAELIRGKGAQAAVADLTFSKRRVAEEGHLHTGAYADAKEPWFLDAYRRAWEWADTTGWRP